MKFKLEEMIKKNINYLPCYYDNGACELYRKRDTDAGFDLAIRQNTKIVVHKDDVTVIDTGVHICIPDGYVGFTFSRSSMALKGFVIENGVIDSGFKGQIKLFLHSKNDYVFTGGERIAQVVILPLPNFRPHTLSKEDWQGIETERGNLGYGSSGI